MHYDDMIHDYGYDWDEEPKVVTSISENAINLKRLIMQRKELTNSVTLTVYSGFLNMQ